jgi:hypothetical protein
MPTSNDPMATVRQYVDGFNSGDKRAMAAACADPMQILDGMWPHVWRGPTASDDWYAIGEPRHIDISGDYAYVVVPATLEYNLQGKHLNQAGAVFTVALRKVDAGGG